MVSRPGVVRVVAVNSKTQSQCVWVLARFVVENGVYDEPPRTNCSMQRRHPGEMMLAIAALAKAGVSPWFVTWFVFAFFFAVGMWAEVGFNIMRAILVGIVSA